MVSKPESLSASASSWGCRRTRRWVARVPPRSARYVSSLTLSTEAVTCETAAWSSSGRLQPSSSATLSASGTLAGIDLERAGPDHVAVGGLGGELDPPAAGPCRDPSGVDGLADQVGRLGRAHVDGGGEPDGAVDHHPHPHAELGVVGAAFGDGVAQSDFLGADALDPDLGVGAPGGLGGRERGVGQGAQVVGGERH